MRLCVTGGAGFIGSAFVDLLLARGTVGGRALERVVVLDALTYAGNLENLQDARRDDRFAFVHGSITDRAAVAEAGAGCDAIVNFAAETHVDRSLEDAEGFLSTNVEGTRMLLDACSGANMRLVQVSTDEVYGSLGAEGLFTEATPLDPSSPYAASKAAADLLVGAWVRSYGLDAVITRCGNNYGPRQFPEKLIPLFVTNALENRELPLYGDGGNVRDWIHVSDHCRAILTALEHGRTGAVYNVSAGCERSNLDLCRSLLDLLGKPWNLVRFVADRPGHDRRYALASDRIREELGWRPEITFEDGLAATVRWYVEHRGWWERVRSGAYLDYYERLYGDRLRQSDDAGGGPSR